MKVPITFNFSDLLENHLGWIDFDVSDPRIQLFAHDHVLAPSYVQHENGVVELVGLSMIPGALARRKRENIDQEAADIVQQMLLDYTDWVNGQPINWTGKKKEGLGKLDDLLRQREIDGLKKYYNQCRMLRTEPSTAGLGRYIEQQEKEINQ